MKIFINNCIDSVRRFFYKLSSGHAVDKHFFFVHIPKTAGTSFRAAFELTAVTYKDYKSSTKIFSPSISQLIYKNNDFYRFKKIFISQSTAWITGHVKLGKYVDLVPITHTITFVRDPVKRVVSQYQHHSKHHGFSGDLLEFLTRPITKNGQSRCVDYIPLSLMGFIGITEKYNQSLSFINHQFGLALPIKTINTNRESKESFEKLDEEIKSIIIKNNSADFELYQEALFLHEARKKLLEEKQPWTYGYAVINAKDVLNGCAYQYNDDQAIEVVIKTNDEIFKTILAKAFYGLYPKANFPRERYIGFNVTLPKGLTDQDEINVYVKSTGQKLNFKPLTVKK